MDLRAVLSDSAVSAIRIAVSILRGILIVPIIVKLLGTAEYGIWSTLLAVIGLVTTTGGLHLHGALNRYAERDGPNTSLGTALTLSSVMAIVAASIFGIGIVGLAGEIDSLTELQPAAVAVVGMGLVITKIPAQVLVNQFRAQLHVKRFELLLLVRQVALSAGILGALYLYQDLLTGLLAMLIVWVVAVVLLGLWALWRYSLSFDWQVAKRYLRYGIPWVPKESAGSLTAHADKIIILAFIGPTATGIYAVAYGVTNLLNRATDVVNSTLYPRLGVDWEQGNQEDVGEFYELFLGWYSALVIPAAVGLALLAPSLLRVMANATTAERGAVLVPVFAIGIFFRGIENVFAMGVAANEQTIALGGSTLIGAAINVVLNLLLIPIIGLLGAALATVTVQILKTSYLVHLFRREVLVSLPWKHTLQASVGSAVMVGVLLPFRFLGAVQEIVVFPLAGAAVYCASMILLGAVPEEIIVEGKRRFSP